MAQKRKKVSSKKATARKAPAKKASTKKVAVKKASTKKVAAKKTAGKKPVTKKTVGRKVSSKKTRAVRRKNKPLAKNDFEHFKQLLLAKRREILVNVNEIGDEALKKSRMDASGDLSSMPIHMADLGSDNFEQEFALGLLDSEVRLLAQIDAALGRIEEGTYGICEGTGEPIGKPRLEAKPWARYCVEYARKIEQGLVFESEEDR